MKKEHVYEIISEFTAGYGAVPDLMQPKPFDLMDDQIARIWEIK